ATETRRVPFSAVDEPRGRARTATRDVVGAAVLANSLGGATVYVFLQWLTSGPGANDRHARISAAVAVPYIVVSAVLMYGRSLRRFPAAIEWLADGREPTAEERANTLAQPGSLTVRFFGYWVAGAAAFGLLNAAYFG